MERLEEGWGDLGVVILKASLKRSGFVHYLYVHNAGPGLKRGESKYNVKGNGSSIRGEMVRTVLRTMIMGKQCRQKELKMISGFSSPPATINTRGVRGKLFFNCLDFQIFMKLEQPFPKASKPFRIPLWASGRKCCARGSWWKF